MSCGGVEAECAGVAIVRVHTPSFRVELCRPCFDAFALRMGELPFEPRPIPEGIERVVRDAVEAAFPEESGSGVRAACQGAF